VRNGAVDEDDLRDTSIVWDGDQRTARSLRDYSTRNSTFLAGSEAPNVKELLDEHLSTSAIVLDPWSAATGCAAIAKDVWEGGVDIMGIPVDF
jgi:hypothetical protein